MAPLKAHYIAAGALPIGQDESNLNENTWMLPQLHKWRPLSHQDDLSTSVDNGTGPEYLPPELQVSLLKSPKLAQVSKLFRARWVKLEFRVSQSGEGFIRVHILPDDVHRGTVDRANTTLRKARHSLIAALDYSREAWDGESRPINGVSDPDSKSSGERTPELSLLQLFNTIPSPDPTPDDLMDNVARDAMFDLLESKVHGLKTELYSYQRRSAAAMLQKEAQPGRIVDPRLREEVDQGGRKYYFDSVSGTMLSEPRYYDGISGGILAEEMGSGKTIICLALILASRGVPTRIPDLYGVAPRPVRPSIGSLLDMAASCATRHAIPWRPFLDVYGAQDWEFRQCVEATHRNPGYYLIPPPELRRGGRYTSYEVEVPPPEKVYLSASTLVVVPNNLVAQWRQEIQKHTDNLSVLTITKKDVIPDHLELLDYDIILFSQSKFEMLVTSPDGFEATPLVKLHFKRCIIDEGHKLGNSKIGKRSNLLIGLDHLRFDSRWVVTGTPSHGLFGVEDGGLDLPSESGPPANVEGTADPIVNQSSSDMERKDLERIGSMAALFLKARPWANSVVETGDSPADWDTYLMLPRHKKCGHGRWDSLRTTLDSLILRHRLTEVGEVLPPVKEKIVVLNGSYQDQLSMNIFSMMIIFNSVQSQRTDMDYFFHPKQRRSLMQIVHNLKQSSFFGGSFFTSSEIAKAVETAEEFLLKKLVPISPDDEALLRRAIALGHIAMSDELRNLSNQFHEIPVCVEGFPGGAGQSWALDTEAGEDGIINTSASLLLALQKLVYNTAGAPEKLNALLNGGFAQEGMIERQKLFDSQQPTNGTNSKSKQSQTLAGNTKLGGDSPNKSRSHGINGAQQLPLLSGEGYSDSLESTKILATVSAKMSYLLDQIIKYQDEEKILIFYENESVAWYLASMLDVMQIQHLIYAKGVTTERRAQYVNTFHHNPMFRILLMDLSQAAFGLDMREASRIYFINPVLNPQVEAQAIGRARRVSQKKPVSVETLVLKNSIDEVILERKEHMTQAEHRQVKSILDIRPIYNWIKNADIGELPEHDGASASHMVPLEEPQKVFGRGFGRTLHPDEGLVPDSPTRRKNGRAEATMAVSEDMPKGSTKRAYHHGPGFPMATEENGSQTSEATEPNLVERPARRIRFADED